MFKVITINKITKKEETILFTTSSEQEAESFCDSWGWSYDDGNRSYWLDYAAI